MSFFYLGKRILSSLLLLVFLPLLTFWLMHLVPGNYFDQLRFNPQISQSTVEYYEKLYHLQEPIHAQYAAWLKQLCRFDLGYSFAFQQPVFKILASRLGNTILLTGVSLLWAWSFAVFLGLLAARYPRSILNGFLKWVAFAGLSLPNFFLCLLLLHLAARWGGLPLGGMHSIAYESFSQTQKVVDIIRHLAIPSFVLGLGIFCYLFRLMRAQAQEVLEKDFILCLRTWRVSEIQILFKHVARNAINPLVTLLGMQLPALVSGAALVEIFSGWPGLGQVMLQAVRSQDLFLVLGNMVMVSGLLVLGNFVSDLLLVWIDPRIRIAGERHS